MEAISKPIAGALGVEEATATVLLLGLFLLLFLALLFALILSRKSTKASKVLLMGLPDAGKTHIFLNLVTGPKRNDGRTTNTYTSVQDNVYEGVRLETDAEPLTLVDIPGADKLRAQGLAKHLAPAALASAKAILFVVDAGAFAKSAKEVAELLYQVLACRRRGRPPLAVLCHKADLPTAKGPAFIRSALAREFDLLEKSHAAALDSTDGAAKMADLGSLDWESLPFLATSGLPNEEANLRPLREWLLQL